MKFRNTTRDIQMIECSDGCRFVRSGEVSPDIPENRIHLHERFRMMYFFEEVKNDREVVKVKREATTVKESGGEK